MIDSVANSTFRTTLIDGYSPAIHPDEESQGGFFLVKTHITCMIHPHTELKFISPEMGYGVFATSFIPTGTITYVKDSLELQIKPKRFDSMPPEMRKAVDKYSYKDQKGTRIISWDFAKYVNHCCNCNTLSTGYGFEIAIRDIQPGEEITDDYGLFNIDEPFPVSCANGHCRKTVYPNDIDTFSDKWDALLKNCIMNIFKVEQPLFPLIDSGTLRKLEKLKENVHNYISVNALKHPK